MTEHNEIREPRLDLTQAVRDTLGRAMLSTAYRNLKASGEIPASAKVKPAPAADVALITAAYQNCCSNQGDVEMRLDLKQEFRDMLGRFMGSTDADGSAEVKPAPVSDFALIAAAYQYLQEMGQLPLDQPDVIMCVKSSDELTDFFMSNGVGDCQEIVCKFIGIESFQDLKLITAEDLQGSRFSDWASGSLTMVQYKKLLKAFS